MAASVWAVRAFATRPREGTGVECCLLRPNLPDFDTLFTSTTTATPDSATPDSATPNPTPPDPTTPDSAIPDPATSTLSTTYTHIWVVDISIIGGDKVRVSGHCYTDRDIGGDCGGEGLEGVYFLHPTQCTKYLVCASGRVVEMWNAEGTVLSIRGFVATRDLHGAKCACDGSTLV
ncbi:hypothetical protein Pmani_036456 [Petrolisthes manimaculis]|uniref:Uncharacterized protein n=1 Tax=Petrolisthes manimaculis TaxID=1843537 RepID=A0AAE1TME0_9EUCA|nr:hypothetical protein Pmani_036456 [Petrolisthes manimaculis]